MKCKYCNGTGCNDTQRGTIMTEFPPCPWCGGSGYIKDKEQTNEEWRKTCSAEEFAEWISNLSYACMRCGMSNGEAYCHTGYCIQDKEGAEKWLKQPRRED